MTFELTQDYIDQLKNAIEANNRQFVSNQVRELLPIDIASIIYELEMEEAKFIFQCFEKNMQAAIIREIEEGYRSDFLKLFSTEEIANYLLLIDSDDVADIVNELGNSESVINHIAQFDKEKASDIQDLMHYDEDSAGGLMQKELIRANLNWTVDKCVEEMKIQSKRVGKFYSVYVVNDANKLLGRVSVKKMLISDDNTLISEIYQADLISAEATMHANEVADLMQKYDLMAIPVVNHQGKLLGRITIDDIVDVITDKAEEERQVMAGVVLDVEEDDTVWLLTKSRLPWLMIGMIGGMAGAQYIGLYENFLSLIPAMAFFIPLITATGGNVGIQASSLIVQSLARDPHQNNLSYDRLRKGFLVACINGLALGFLVFGLNYIFGHDLKLAIVVSIALFCVIVISSIMGTITPIVLNKFGINPAIASGPFITTVNDLVGLAVYFMVAALLYTF